MTDLHLDTLESPRFRKLRVAGNLTISVDGDTLVLDTDPRITVGTEAPTAPALTDLWVDTTASPAVLKVWSGTAWV